MGNTAALCRRRKLPGAGGTHALFLSCTDGGSRRAESFASAIFPDGETPSLLIFFDGGDAVVT
ncbi:MAG: hypothetical protein IKZ84_19940, partial [Victivallales bacterium]|nr:hypothetical protein [Victivallales bacterium]